MAAVDSDTPVAQEEGDSLVSLLEALDQENASLRERLIATGADAAGAGAKLEVALEALSAARKEAEEAALAVRDLGRVCDQERTRAALAEGNEQALRSTLERRTAAAEAATERVAALEAELRSMQAQTDERLNALKTSSARAAKDQVNGERAMRRDEAAALRIERQGRKRAKAALARASHELAGAVADRERLTAELARRDEVVADLKAEREALQAKLGHSRGKLVALRASRSYRLARRLGSLGSIFNLGRGR